MANIGINLVEVDGRATPSIQGASTSVAGFIIRSPRGLAGKVWAVTNFSEFVEYFGSYSATAGGDAGPAFGAYAIKGFFDNGGALAYVTRVVDTTTADKKAVLATLNVPNNTGMSVSAAYHGQDDYGAWANQISVAVTANAASGVDPASWDLTVSVAGKVVEIFDHLPRNPTSANKVNDQYSGSRYIKLTFAMALVDGVAAITTTQATSLAGGADDTLTQAEVETSVMNHLGAQGDGTFDTYDVQLIACPETTKNTVLAQGTAYAAGRGDCIYIAAAPDNVDVGATQNWGVQQRGANVYGAVYFPFLRVNDPLGTTRWVPPIGHVMGVYARTERERGVWKAPAGVNAQVRGVLDVRYHISDTKHTELVKKGGVNAVRYLAGQGIIIDSSRTLSANPLWQYVNVRLLFNFVKSSLKGGLRWVVQEPNDEHLWNKVKHNSVVPFLNDLWRRGAFGPGERADVYSVKIDKENNPGPNIQQGILNVEVYFYPSRPAETFIITVGQQEGGPSASES